MEKTKGKKIPYNKPVSLFDKTGAYIGDVLPNITEQAEQPSLQKISEKKNPTTQETQDKNSEQADFDSDKVLAFVIIFTLISLVLLFLSISF